MTASAPAASAARSTVPALPGSRTFASSATRAGLAAVTWSSGTSTKSQTASRPCGVTVWASSLITSPLTSWTSRPASCACATRSACRAAAGAVTKSPVTCAPVARASETACGPSARKARSCWRSARLVSLRAALSCVLPGGMIPPGTPLVMGGLRPTVYRRGDDPPAPPAHGRASPLRSLPTGGRHRNRGAPRVTAGVKALGLLEAGRPETGRPCAATEAKAQCLGRRADGLRQRLARDLDQGGEGRRVGHGEVGEDTPVNLDARRLQALHEAVVGQPVRARRGVDALDPEPAEVALTVLAVPVGVGHRVEDLLLGLAVEPGPLAPVALRPLEDNPALLLGVKRALDACHRSISLWAAVTRLGRAGLWAAELVSCPGRQAWPAGR